MEKEECILELTRLVYKECKSVPPGIKYKIGQIFEKYSPTISQKRAAPKKDTKVVVNALQTDKEKKTTIQKLTWPKNISNQQAQGLRVMKRNGKELEAVKKLKELSGLGLKESKQLIDSL